MKRKHMAGCYCCLPEDECPVCCENESIPTSIRPHPASPDDWVRDWRSYDSECCCLKERWQYVNPNPVQSCCELIGSDYWQTVDHRIDHAFKLPDAYYAGKPPWHACSIDCPETEEECCIQEDYKVGEWTETISSTQTHYFAVDFFWDYVDISWTREEVRCPDANGNAMPEGEPACRYVMKIVLYGHWKSRINTKLEVSSDAENIYTHPCWSLSPACTPGIPNCEQLFTGCSQENQWCEASEEVGSGFNQGVCFETQEYINCEETGPNCKYGYGAFYWERIKYFENPPSGPVFFEDEDIIEENPFDATVDCDEPVCKVDALNGYAAQQIVVFAPAFEPPTWCTHPPTIETNVVNHTIDYSFCQTAESARPDRKFTITSSSCCDPDALQSSALCDAVFCENPITIQTSCDELLYTDVSVDPEDCRFSSRFGPFVACGLSPFPWNILFDTNTRVCGEYPPLGGQPQFLMQLNLRPCFSGAFPGEVGDCPPEGTPQECCEERICADDNFPNCDGRCFCFPKHSGYGFVKSLDVQLTIDCGPYTIPSCVYDIPPFPVDVTL